MTHFAFKRLAFIVLTISLLPGCRSDRAGTEQHMAPAEVVELIKTCQSWDGNLLPAYPEGQPEVTILRITIPSGTRLDMHHHPIINAGVLISGQLTVYTIDGKTLKLNAGDPIVEVVNTLHYGVNEGDVEAEIIVFYAGITGHPITIIQE